MTDTLLNAAFRLCLACIVQCERPIAHSKRMLDAATVQWVTAAELCARRPAPRFMHRLRRRQAPPSLDRSAP
ncbi:hypothetical protein BVH03_05640 [Pseudomonas sp. PA15(2017)]|nr:hypothetical protein BVH03_05640 [Pseudomonas sp. PA15(2017)]